MARTIPRAVLAVCALLMPLSSAPAQQSRKPVFKSDGTVTVPSFELPPSVSLSPEALALQKARANAVEVINPIAGETDIAASRAASNASHAHQVAEAKRRYPARIVEQVFGGARRQVIAPASGKPDPRRVLITLHGGGWSRCAEACALVESLPIASLGRFKVVT